MKILASKFNEAYVIGRFIFIYSFRSWYVWAGIRYTNSDSDTRFKVIGFQLGPFVFLYSLAVYKKPTKQETKNYERINEER